MKSQVLYTVWCNISGEAAGEIWHWSLLGVKGLVVICSQKGVRDARSSGRVACQRSAGVSLVLNSLDNFIIPLGSAPKINPLIRWRQVQTAPINCSTWFYHCGRGRPAALLELLSKCTFSQPIQEKCISEVVRISSIIIFHLNKLWKAKVFVLCVVIFLVRLQGKFEIDLSLEWKGFQKPNR